MNISWNDYMTIATEIKRQFFDRVPARPSEYDALKRRCMGVAEYADKRIAELEQQLAAAREEIAKVRKILAHVPARIAIEAKESAGYGDEIKPLSYAEIREMETDENDVREI